jgi:pyruvate dehydrogenase E2 component (dihydrolipoamide acetyltransferase)
VDTEQGLTVAVLRSAQDLTLDEIVKRTRALVEKARAGRLSVEERTHPTFTITNLGMFDVEHFEPIVNAPSAVTLGVSSALPAPVVRDDAIYISNVMKLTASCDHRIIDGATAARFLSELRKLLETPEQLLAGA